MLRRAFGRRIRRNRKFQGSRERPAVLDVVYKVTSDKATVNVRALAFEDGERSFLKVVRPETFIDGTAANIGDNIAANVEHSLAWKVSSDWDTDLAKVKFEILTSDQGKLPLDFITVPGLNGVPDITFSYNSQTAANVLNAMYWYYANGEQDLVIDDGYLKTTNNVALVSRNVLGDQQASTEYIADKMGLEVFGGSLFHYAVGAIRKKLSTAYDSLCVKGMFNVSGSYYVGDKAYCVIDISGGTSAASYPVTYLDSFPIAGWGDEYKTTKIILRRIEPGTVTMGGTKPVTLTKPFYMGVFQVTQKQYKLVTGNDPSYYKGDMRPVEGVSWNTIRGNSSTYNWPNVTTVDANSFIGKLQAKTGLNFDLPTESQWEYACKAGTTSYFNNGTSNESDLKMLGRYSRNCNDGKGGYSQHTTVGSYFPNAWGLYDMHGNVLEWCLDWFSSINSDPVTDWAGASSGSYRILRGGCWESNWGLGYIYSSTGYTDYYCQSSSRSYCTHATGFYIVGFRLSRTLNDE